MAKTPTKIVHKLALGKEIDLQDMKEALTAQHACYVLITCSEPQPDGKMHVEMSYDGDISLAAYLVESAQSILEQLETSLDSV
jgi:hypothetical protein